MGKVSKFFKSKLLVIVLAVTAVLTTVGAAAFVGADKGNFAPKFESVAFIDSDTPANSYYTIEDALKAAQPGSTVYVRPGKNPIFMGSKTDPAQNTIKEKVTLSLPLSFDTAGKAYYGWTVKEGEAIHTGAIYNIYTNTTTNVLTNQLIIAEGATLINYGTIYIGGELSGGGGASSGHTQGKYAKIHMMNNSKIVCGEEIGGKRGNIKCLGYITEEAGADTNIYFHKGDLRMPFLVRDFRGGNASLSIYIPYVPILGLGSAKHAISPFNQFELRNIESRLHLSYYSSLNAYCNLYAGSQQNATIGRIVGSDPSSLIEFTDSKYSQMISKYNKDTEVCDVYFYGGVKMNALTLAIQKPVEVTIDTSVVYFPLSWRYQITLAPAEGQLKANFSINKMLKLLPGCKLTIRKGAKLSVNSLTSFDFSAANPRANPGYNDAGYAIVGSKYVSDTYPKSKENASIVVDGEFSAANLGGYITSGNKGALLSISNSASQTTYEAIQSNKLANCDQDTLVNPARGKVGSADAAISNLSTLSYVSQGTHWVVNNINYTVVYKSFMEETGTIENYDGNGNVTSGNTTQNYTLNTPTYASDPSIKFAGWYYDVIDGKCVDYLENNTLTGSAVAGHLNGGTVVTVYARWVKARTIRVEYLSPSGVESTLTDFTPNALTSLAYGLPDGNKISFKQLADPDNKAHYTAYAFDSWGVMDGNKDYLPGYEACKDKSVLIPSDYAYDVIYLIPNYTVYELYKVTLTGDRANFPRNFIYVDGVELPREQMYNGSILYFPLGTKIKVVLRHRRSWDEASGKTQCDVYDLYDKRIAGPVKSESYSGSDQTTGDMILGEKGMKINLGSI